MIRPVVKDQYDYEWGVNDDSDDMEEEMDCGWEDVYSALGCTTGIEH